MVICTTIKIINIDPIKDHEEVNDFAFDIDISKGRQPQWMRHMSSDTNRIKRRYMGLYKVLA